MSILMFCMATLDKNEYTFVPSDASAWRMETVFTIIFTLEFVVRIAVWESIWVAKEGSGITPFGRELLNWIDFVSIVPFYAEAVVGILGITLDDESSGFIKMLRLVRVMRIFKLLRHFEGTKIMAMTARKSFKPLVLPVFFLGVVAMCFAAVIFFVEPCISIDDCVFSDIFNTGYYVMVT